MQLHALGSDHKYNLLFTLSICVLLFTVLQFSQRTA